MLFPSVELVLPLLAPPQRLAAAPLPCWPMQGKDMPYGRDPRPPADVRCCWNTLELRPSIIGCDFGGCDADGDRSLKPPLQKGGRGAVITALPRFTTLSRSITQLQFTTTTTRAGQGTTTNQFTVPRLGEPNKQPTDWALSFDNRWSVRLPVGPPCGTSLSSYCRVGPPCRTSGFVAAEPPPISLRSTVARLNARFRAGPGQHLLV